ncbi:MAG: NUDIX domain-containing protein [Chloroflexi bacterium]|nr:NUDIX domain-containing protein [Chloroflexota bacterium]
MNPTYIDKLAWIQIVDRRILSTRSRGKGTYYIPGGKREAGESDAQALMREIREELSVDLMTGSLHYLETFEAQAHGKAAGVIVRMTCYTGDYVGELKPASEIEEMAWLVHSDWTRSSPVDKLIFDWLRERDLID